MTKLEQKKLQIINDFLSFIIIIFYNWQTKNKLSSFIFFSNLEKTFNSPLITIFSIFFGTKSDFMSSNSAEMIKTLHVLNKEDLTSFFLICILALAIYEC